MFVFIGQYNNPNAKANINLLNIPETGDFSPAYLNASLRRRRGERARGKNDDKGRGDGRGLINKMQEGAYRGLQTMVAFTSIQIVPFRTHRDRSGGGPAFNGVVGNGGEAVGGARGESVKGLVGGGK
ncbi:hypothetical protein GWI33_020944 [Rhynchophorus ferrugineus]|uniref:Uncharacterized protein n=1 Tax=Rhynchophorus ferrugineus TaxID=354439 RepID=A0A834HRF3_RHYFE|nr:hypothetical protein GWI33_020944 [Rhynchophorus ferrugineus]